MSFFGYRSAKAFGPNHSIVWPSHSIALERDRGSIVGYAGRCLSIGIQPTKADASMFGCRASDQPRVDLNQSPTNMFRDDRDPRSASAGFLCHIPIPHPCWTSSVNPDRLAIVCAVSDFPDWI